MIWQANHKGWPYENPLFSSLFPLSLSFSPLLPIPNWKPLLTAALYMGAIFLVSSQPGDRVGIPAPWDKLVHATVYAVLGVLLQLGLGRPVVAWAVAALYGLSDEVHHYFVPGRMFDWGDWLADMVGAALGVYAALRWRRVSKMEKASESTTTVPTPKSK